MATVFRRLIPGCVLCLAAVVPASAAEPIEERFQTELGETMRCVYTAGDPAVSDGTLRLWLELRYPFESFGFPGIERGIPAADVSSWAAQVSENLAAQGRAIDSLASVAPDEPIRPLHGAVLSTFRREYDYSRALADFLEHQDARRFVRTLDDAMRLPSAEQEKILSIAGALSIGKVTDDLRSEHEMFLSRHVMVDGQGRHFTDFHREFIRKYRIGIDCRCAEKC